MFLICLPVQAEEIGLDVVDGEMRTGNYRILLADQEKPIRVELVDGELVVTVDSPSGTVQLRLGQGTLAITERAVPYVSMEIQTVAAPTNRSAGSGPSPTKRPEAALCPRCAKPYAAHDDIACGYRLNPVPTPCSTTNEEGKRVTSYVAPDGSYYVGPLPGKKNKEWTPGVEYLENLATPSPTPDLLNYVTPRPR